MGSKREAFTTHLPVWRTRFIMALALDHRSALSVRLHSSSSRVILSMRSCFLPVLVRLVWHSSLKPVRICLSCSTLFDFKLCRSVCCRIRHNYRTNGMQSRLEATYLKVCPCILACHELWALEQQRVANTAT